MQAVSAGLLAGFVGFASSFAVVLQGLVAVGASPAQAASGLMALSIAMGLAGILLSLRLRLPVSVAWSTPGAALLAATAAPAGGFGEAVGAFLVCGVLLTVAGLWKPLGRAVAAIPAPLANAMLAGILFTLCLAPVRAVAEQPAAGLAIVLAWAVVARLNRLLAVPAAVIVAVGVIAASAPLPAGGWMPEPVLVMPSLSFAAVTGIALPLFIVTMASQNIPGLAVLSANGYRPEAGPLFATTGAFSLVSAPFGGHAVNLAAITAALCVAAVVAGATYVAFGLLAGAVTVFVAAAPPVLIQAVAGLALLGPFGGAMLGAVHAPQGREAALVCFVVTASGVAFLGIGGAFWGLLAGGGMMVLARWRA
jgi:benzoate membrane transport protein